MRADRDVVQASNVSRDGARRIWLQDTMHREPARLVGGVAQTVVAQSLDFGFRTQRKPEAISHPSELHVTARHFPLGRIRLPTGKSHSPAP